MTTPGREWPMASRRCGGGRDGGPGGGPAGPGGEEPGGGGGRAGDEGLGMPSMEAMACGAALVTYDNGGCRDYALDGRTALVARRRDVAHLAQRLELAVCDPGLRAKLAREGMAHIKREFDWGRAVAKMEALFALPPGKTRRSQGGSGIM